VLVEDASTEVVVVPWTNVTVVASVDTVIVVVTGVITLATIASVAVTEAVTVPVTCSVVVTMGVGVPRQEHRELINDEAKLVLADLFCAPYTASRLAALEV